MGRSVLDRLKTTKDRRKQARAAIALLQQRVQRICAPAASADKVAGQVADVVERTRAFIDSAEARELVSAKMRRRISHAVGEFEEAKGRIDKLAEACTRLQGALKYSDIALAQTWHLGPVAAAVAGIAVAGVLVAGAVIVRNGVTIDIENNSGDSIRMPGGLDPLPGVDLPANIAPGARGTVRVPRAFAGSFEARADEVIVHAFGATFDLSVTGLDLQKSTWDGKPLESLEGSRVPVGAGDTHNLVIFGR